MAKQPVHNPAGFAVGMGVACSLAILLSLLASFNSRPAVLMFDENYYYPLAERIMDGTYQDGYVVRPPLYPLFLAGIFGIFGKGFTSILIIQSILRGLTVGLAGWLGRKYCDARAGLLTAIILACYPLFIWTYTRFVSETIYLPLFLVSFALLERALRSQIPRDMWTAGLGTGLAALARSTSLIFGLVVACWLAVRKTDGRRLSRPALKNVALFLVGTLVIIAPWTVRNAVVHRTLMLVDSATPFNLWLITSGKNIKQVEEEWLTYPSQAERQREGYRRWLEHLKSDPLFHLKRVPRVASALLNPRRDPALNSLAVIIHGTAVRHNQTLRRILGIVVPVWLGLILGGGILGIVIVEKDRPRRDLVILLVCFFVLLHGMTLARPRFLLPMNVVLAIYAGGLISKVLSRWGLTRRNPPSPS